MQQKKEDKKGKNFIYTEGSILLGIVLIAEILSIRARFLANFSFRLSTEHLGTWAPIFFSLYGFYLVSRIFFRSLRKSEINIAWFYKVPILAFLGYFWLWYFDRINVYLINYSICRSLYPLIAGVVAVYVSWFFLLATIAQFFIFSIRNIVRVNKD